MYVGGKPLVASGADRTDETITSSGLSESKSNFENCDERFDAVFSGFKHILRPRKCSLMMPKDGTLATSRRLTHRLGDGLRHCSGTT